MFLLSWADNHETKGSVPPESDTRIYIGVGLGSLFKMALPFLGPQSRKYAFLYADPHFQNKFCYKLTPSLNFCIQETSSTVNIWS